MTSNAIERKNSIKFLFNLVKLEFDEMWELNITVVILSHFFWEIVSKSNQGIQVNFPSLFIS